MKHAISVLMLSCGLCGPGAVAQEAVPRPAKVFEVAELQDRVERVYPAIVLPSRETLLSFRVPGNVVELPITAAMDVAEGDLIAKLDTRDFETDVALLQSQIDQATAQLDALRAGAREEEIAALEAGVASAEAQLEAARDALSRTRQLVERGVSTTAQLEGVQAEFRVAEANLVAQQEQLRIGQVGGRPEDIAASEAAIRGLETQLQAARDRLADATLTAPFDGIIARRDIENFSNIQAGTSVALLQTLSPAHLAFDIPGADVTLFTQLGVENLVNVASFDAFPGEAFATELVEFSLAADEATQTYRGRVSADIPERGGVLPGMVANVTISVATETASTLVPVSAIAAEADGAPFVWIVGADNSVAARPVTLGELQGGMVVVEDGVAAGDVIVSAGVSRITPGQVIRPITKVGN